MSIAAEGTEEIILYKAPKPKVHRSSKLTKPSAKPSSRSNGTAETPSLRKLGDKPTWDDLDSVIFSHSTIFQIGETVLVPRSRGGFCYGKVTHRIDKHTCFLEEGVEHIGQVVHVWRVVYPNYHNEMMKKDLPSAYLGKLSEAMQPASAPPPADSSERVIGQKPSMRDLENVLFGTSTNTGLNPGEMVIVPRTRGGFSLGMLSAATPVSCVLQQGLDPALRHSISGWKVFMSEDKKAWKDVIPGWIGKLVTATSPDQPQAPPTPLVNSVVASALQANATNGERSKKPRNEKKRNKDKSYGTPPSVPSLIEQNDEDDAEDQVPHVEANLQQLGQQLQEQGKVQMPGVLPVEALPSPSQNGSHKHKSNKRREKPRYRDNEPQTVNEGEGEETAEPQAAATTTTEQRPPSPRKKRLVCIDGPNVAMKHGNKKGISVNGIKIALDYWTKRGFDAIAFLPEHYVSRKPQTGAIKLSEFMPLCDNTPLVLSLVDAGKIILTPPQDYDDSYVIRYAKIHNGFIVTNDRYWDHIDKQEREDKRWETKKWLREHCISFTFVRDEFLPNPDFVFPTQS